MDPINYTVTFNGNGATGGSTASQSIASGASATLNTNGFTYTGFSFVEWNTASDGSGTSYADAATYTMGKADLTLYAQWVVFVPPCFSEDFSSIVGGNNTGTTGSSTAWAGNANFPTVNAAYQAGSAVRLGTGSATGSIETAALSGVSGNVTVSIDVKGWTTVEGNLSVTLGGSTQTQSYSSTISDPFETRTFLFTGVPANSTLVIATTSRRAFLDNVILTCSATPEINLQGNGNNILNGSPSPLLTNHTDFGSASLTGATVTRTFTIQNLGAQALNLTAPSPYVSISGAHASDFTLSINPSTPIAASGFTTFDITFDPSALGTRTATISIANDDSDENPYTFAIRGEGTNSNQSDIIESAGFTYTLNHDYTAYQAATITSTANSVGVFRFEVRDGAGTADSDALGTELNSISFNLGTTHINYIRSAALFDGNTMRNNTPTIDAGAGTISFSGLSGADFTAPDGGSLTLTLRVSYLTVVTDNEQIQYTISAASANSSGSVFAAANAGGASSSLTGDRNRIEVTADRLGFVQQPVNTTVNLSMSPAVTVEGKDANNNRDLDYTGLVTITSTGTLTGTTVAENASNGLATFSSLVHSVDGTGFNLTASSAFAPVNSSSFDITTFVAGSYRTTSAGNWPNATGAATWERFVSGTWTASTRPAASVTDRIYIRHTITTNAAFAAAAPGTVCTIENGGNFILAHNCTFAELSIENGGIATVQNPAVDINASSGTLTVYAGGKVILNSATLNNVDGFWEGTEDFKNGSTLEIQNWDWDSGSGEERLIDNSNPISTNADGFYFGNLVFNANPIDKAFTVVGQIGTHKLCQNDFTINNQAAARSVILTNVIANI